MALGTVLTQPTILHEAYAAYADTHVLATRIMVLDRKT